MNRGIQYGKVRTRGKTWRSEWVNVDVEGILILDLQGRIIAGESVAALRERTHNLATGETRNVSLT